MTNLTTVFGVVFSIYLLLMITVGYFSSRLMLSPVDFFLGNRSLKAWVTAISSTASSESAWAVLGTVGLAYKDGLSVFWFLPGCLMGYALNWLFVAERLRKYSRQLHAITIPDFLESRFKDETHAIRLIAVLIIFSCMMAYMAAQFTAIGKTFDSIFNIPYSVSIPIGAVVILFYTAMGGFLAVAWTDFFQGLIMVISLVILALVAVAELGGWSNIISQLNQTEPEVLAWRGNKSLPIFLGSVIGLLGIGLGYPGQPHVLNRYMAAKDSKTIRQGTWIAMGWGIVVYSSAIVLGISGRLLIPNLLDPEHLFPRVAEMLLPTIASAVVLMGVLAAIMSTVSAQIIVATSAVAHDIFRKLLHREPTHEKLLLISRITVVVVGLGAMIIALTEVRVIFWFVLFAWSGLGASFGPVILWALYSDKTTRQGAIAGMLTGFITTLLWKATGLSESIVYELVPAFLFAFIMVGLVSKVTRKV